MDHQRTETDAATAAGAGTEAEMIDQILLVRSISGEQAKVVLVFIFTRRGMSIEELEHRTGLGRRALYRACEELSKAPYCLLARQTLPHNKTVWMPAGALLPGTAEFFFNIPDVPLEHNWINNNDLNQEPILLSKESLLLEMYPAGTTEATKAEPEHQNPAFDACRQVAKRAGIGEPSASIIAELKNPESGEWITPELITAQCKALKRPSETIGLAIHRLKDWQPVPGQAEQTERQDLRGADVQAMVDEFMGRRK